MTHNYFLDSKRILSEDRIIVFREGRIVMEQENYFWSPNLIEKQIAEAEPLLLVSSGKRKLLVLDLDSDDAIPPEAEVVPLRSLLFKSEQALATAGKANQILDWYKAHQFCGYCGDVTTPDPEQLAVHCKGCSHHFFPRINPCVIVLVLKGDKMLLAKNARYRTGFLSCLAGFIEVGESAEDTVLREVKEESGLDVENIRYFKSQSWPFPSQLMLGFYADYKAGEIVPEPGEIEEADWYGVDDLPQVPSGKISVAGELIENFVGQMQYKAD